MLPHTPSPAEGFSYAKCSHGNPQHLERECVTGSCCLEVKVPPAAWLYNSYHSGHWLHPSWVAPASPHLPATANRLNHRHDVRFFTCSLVVSRCCRLPQPQRPPHNAAFIRYPKPLIFNPTIRCSTAPSRQVYNDTIGAFRITIKLRYCPTNSRE